MNSQLILDVFYCGLIILLFIMVVQEFLDAWQKTTFKPIPPSTIYIEKEIDMTGDPPPKECYTIVFNVTVECNNVASIPRARRAAFDLINVATLENDEYTAISSIQVDEIIDNNPRTQVLNADMD